MLIREIVETPRERDPAPQDTADMIKKYCRPWLTQAGTEQFLSRGIREPWRPEGTSRVKVFVKNIRTDRKPRDSSKKAHRIFNMLIDMVGGVANRSNSMFAHITDSYAGLYGRYYVVFPVGEFHYTWSPEFKDLTMNLEDKFYKLMDVSDETKQKAYQKYKGAWNSIGVLGGWSKPKHEILGKMVYKTLDPTDPKSYNIQKVRKSFKADEGLSEFMKSREREIMIHAEKAIYVEKKYFEDLVWPLLRS